MGRWSAALAPSFLRFACVQPPRSVLDVGCGTGSLLRAALESWPTARLVGLDPASAYLAHARSDVGAGPAVFVAGVAEKLPFADQTFDACVSLLVLQEIREPDLAVAEMRRVTAIGGVVAACQWDFASGMPIIAALRQALEVAVPVADQKQNGVAHVFGSEAELRRTWEEAGLRGVRTTRLVVTLRYGSFAELWRPLLGGPTPTTSRLASLPARAQGDVQRRFREAFVPSGRKEAFPVTCEAFAVRGQV